MITKLYASLFALFGFVGLHAQDISTKTITWNSVSAVNQVDSKTVNYNCSFTSHGISSLLWTQGAKVSTYSVNAFEGSWFDVSKDGQTSYNITSDQNSAINGTCIFSMSAGRTSIHLKLLLNNVVQADYIFSIASTTIGK